jgi:hypothetical protein
MVQCPHGILLRIEEERRQVVEVALVRRGVTAAGLQNRTPRRGSDASVFLTGLQLNCLYAVAVFGGEFAGRSLHSPAQYGRANTRADVIVAMANTCIEALFLDI